MAEDPIVHKEVGLEVESRQDPETKRKSVHQQVALKPHVLTSLRFGDWWQ
jgi:hypothetical protein